MRPFTSCRLAIWRIENQMALHDAAMTRFGQWWRRAVQRLHFGARRLSARSTPTPPERHYVWESRRAWIWGLGCRSLALGEPRQHLKQRKLYSLTQEDQSSVKFMADHVFDRRGRLIEYK